MNDYGGRPLSPVLARHIQRLIFMGDEHFFSEKGLPRRAIVGGPLHGIETARRELKGLRIYAHGGFQVWIPDTVPPGDEPTFIARARILGGEA